MTRAAPTAAASTQQTAAGSVGTRHAGNGSGTGSTTPAALATPAAPAVPRLELRGITKAFVGCLANDAVDLTLYPGEIHALLGENGAGKSTLVKILYGALKADCGTVLWHGRPVEIPSPAVARRLGIGMVFQHFKLFDSLTVAENIALGIDHAGPMAELARRIGEVSARYGLALEPGRPVETLSVGERQRVEIVRCLLHEPELLILDEPTSVLTPQEADTLFDTLRRLAGEGCTVLYISHKLEEIRALCSRATILRAGRVAGTCDPRRETARSLAERMLGGTLPQARRPEQEQAPAGPARLVVERLSVPSDQPFGIPLREVGFDVRGGEILGIAGIAGNGQAELLAALSGERPVADDAAIRIDGRPVGRAGPTRRRQFGLAFVPEERLGRGAVPELMLAENALLGSHRRAGLVARGLIRIGRTHEFARRIIGTFGVVAPGSRAEARSLSGGNLQKFIVAREVLQDPGLLIAAAPTWGVDAGAAAAIQQGLIDLAARGAAVLVISQDLDELFAISDRIAVIFRGRLSAARAVQETSVEQIGLWMGGHFETGRGGSDAA